MIDSDIVYVFIFINPRTKDYKRFFLSSKRLCFVSFYTFKNGNYLLTTLTKDSRNAKRCTNKPGNHSTKSKKIIFFFDRDINDIIIYLKKDNVCQIFLQQVNFFLTRQDLEETEGIMIVRPSIHVFIYIVYIKETLLINDRVNVS